VRLRLHGTSDECELATHRLAQVFDVVAVSGPDPDRGLSRLVRVDLELRLDPTPPAPPAMPDQQPARGLP
jgi:hypothetical protein